MSGAEMSRGSAKGLESFTTDQVARITKVSHRRLQYWLERQIITADIDVNRGRRHVRLWSFANLVEVKATVWLRSKHLPLQSLAKIVERLRERGAARPLAEVQIAVRSKPGRLGVRDVMVQFGDGVWLHPISGQELLFLDPWKDFGSELEAAVAADEARRRTVGLIERRRGTLGSEPVFAGTRIPVKAVTDLIDSGWGVDRVLKNYPGLTSRDVETALSARSLRQGVG